MSAANEALWENDSSEIKAGMTRMFRNTSVFPMLGFNKFQANMGFEA